MAKAKPTIQRTKTARESKIWDTLQIIKTFYQNHLWEKWVTAYKNYFMYKLDRAVKIKDFQTNMKSPVVKMYVDAMWTGLYDNSINFRVIGRDRDDQKKADEVKGFLEWGFSVSKSRSELMASIKESLICGPGYLKIGFLDKEETINYKKGTKNVSKTVKKQYPYIKYVSAFNIFIDPTVTSFEESPYVIERNVVHINDFRKYYGTYINDNETIIQEALVNPEYFSAYDYNKIKHAVFRDEGHVKKYFDSHTETAGSDMGNLDTFTQNYLAVDYSNQYVEVINYWTDDEYTLMLNGRIVYDGINPLPIRRKPYVDIQYNKAPGLPFGNGLGVSLADIQKLTDELLNLQMDNTKFQIAPMYQKLKGSDMFSQDRGGLVYEPFKVVEVNTPDGYQKLELGSPEFTGVNTIQFLLQLGEMSEGVNSYSLGYQNKVERSATGVSALVQAFKARLLPLVESMNQALSVIAELWIAIALVMMDEDITVRSMGNDGKPTFTDITLEDLVGKYDIEFDAQALKSATREVKRDQYLQLMNAAASTGVDPNTGQYFIDMRELWRETFDSFEMPQDLVMSSKEVVKQQSSVQVQQAKAQQKVATATQPQGQQQFPNTQEGAEEQQLTSDVLLEEANQPGNGVIDKTVGKNVLPEANLQVEWDILRRALS